ncbi:hypothetical protein [Owenweeksia hongkongensis]|uniref:hypothetical protein n=1 Tax=Owenweeksia hongkongensis TaxID=253245 RepID=UPI003A8D9844
MKIGDIKDSLEPLLNDAFEAEEYLSKNNSSQFARRIYIRSVFSYLEGSIWVFKQVCFKAKPSDNSRRKMSISEYAILNEESYELKGNGDITVTTKNFNLLDNIKFTFKMLNKLFGGELEIGTGTESWTKLIEAKNVRNRITHPKRIEDLTIEDSEIETCQEVCSWFNILSHETFKLLLESGEKAKK